MCKQYATLSFYGKSNREEIRKIKSPPTMQRLQMQKRAKCAAMAMPLPMWEGNSECRAIPPTWIQAVMRLFASGSNAKKWGTKQKTWGSQQNSRASNMDKYETALPQSVESILCSLWRTRYQGLPPMVT